MSISIVTFGWVLCDPQTQTTRMGFSTERSNHVGHGRTGIAVLRAGGVVTRHLGQTLATPYRKYR